MVYRSGSHRACSSSGRRSCGESCPTTGARVARAFGPRRRLHRAIRREAPRALPAAEPFAFGQVHVWTAAGALAAVAAFLVASAFFYRIAPHGIEDAVSIWNLRARFFFRGGDHWTDGFRPVNWHGDYPLLLPCEVARCWTWAGGESTLVPALLGLSFSLATAAALAGGLGLIRGASAGLIAGATLLAHGYYLETSASQLADVPLAFYVLASVVLLALGDRQEPSEGRILYSLGGLCLGLAAWTKNEGLVFLLALPASRLIFRKGAGPWGRSVGEMVAIALGAIPVVVVIYVFKTRFAPPNDLVEATRMAETLARISDPSRYLAILISVAGGTRKNRSRTDPGAGGLRLAPGEVTRRELPLATPARDRAHRFRVLLCSVPDLAAPAGLAPGMLAGSCAAPLLASDALRFFCVRQQPRGSGLD